VLTDYVKLIEKEHNLDIKIKWHDTIKGLLKTISSFPSSGLDFDENMKRFAFHNIYNEDDATPLHLIASKYIELIHIIKI